MIVNGLDIRIINPTTGELLRQLTLDPDRDYQPQASTPPIAWVHDVPMS